MLPGESAIKVLPIKLAQGSKAEHYLRGWEEKEAAGRSLIGDQVELPVRGLEGKAYGDTRVEPGQGPVQGGTQVPDYAPAKPAGGGLDSGWKP